MSAKNNTTKPELLPCPFCGEKSNLWTYISPFAAKIECGQCGIYLNGSCVRTAYKLDEELPEWAVDIASKAECAKDKDDNLVTMWWIQPTDSFFYLGHTERWNRRA